MEVIDKSCEASTSEDILLPYQVIEWENDVILDGEEVKDQLLEEFSNGRGCGWIPTQYTRTYEHFVYAGMDENVKKSAKFVKTAKFWPKNVKIWIKLRILAQNRQILMKISILA